MSAPFFIGWQGSVPRGLRGFLAMVALAVLLGAASLGVLLAAAVDDPGGGQAFWADGPRTLRGVVTVAPYPTLHLPPDAAHPEGRAVPLSGLGKTGVEADPALEGRLVEAMGAMLRRGTQDQMQVEPPGLLPVEGAAVPPATVPLGRWRLVGEICDGKCWNGAMRPGTGIAHRACASLCLIGGIPPVFVATRPVPGGGDILLLGGPEGGPMPPALLDQVGLRISLEGRVERRGALTVLLADPASARAP